MRRAQLSTRYLAGESPVRVITKEPCSLDVYVWRNLCVEAHRQKYLSETGRARYQAVTSSESCRVVKGDGISNKFTHHEFLIQGRNLQFGDE
ncbi:hypothetical protein skT53_24400 [Effusibacillus dendaii]|uniref:Uncharacterized protein n=1 Tax=Effusibacillus dendaii TaxID=2743772 RepID=A0A7I8DBJ3_9BACL|nr:hypothetical protein skT53_24400 [Effusibacillus dendaii]